MNDNFGFIHEKLEIKILILYILRRLPEPVSFDALAELTMCDDGISYFDFSECVAELVKTEHLRVADDMYSLSGKGVRNGETTENSIPYAVRVRADNATSELRSKQNRNSMIKTLHTVNQEGGFTVCLSLSDGIGSIVSMEIFAHNAQQAEALEKGFRKNAEGIYHGLVDLILVEGREVRSEK